MFKFTDRKKIFYTLLPSLLVIVISTLLVNYFDNYYYIEKQKLLVWHLIRNLFNIILVVFFVVSIILFIVKWKFFQADIKWKNFSIHFLLTIILVNFSGVFFLIFLDLLHVISNFIDYIPIELKLKPL